MTTTVIQYPLDLTGTAPGNFVTGEVHDLGSATNRAIVPNHGPFFTRGMVVRSLTSGAVLTPETHYKAVQLFPEATLKTGLEVCTVIVIVDNTLGNNFSIDYHVLGGDYSASVYAIEQLINALEIDERAVRWGQVLGKPEAFPAAPHLHDLGDLYGFEYVVAALESVRQAILTGDAAVHEEIYQYIDHQDQEILNTISGFTAALNTHITDYNNPHQTTKAQVGLGLVQNFGIATTAEAIAGTINSAYMTPLRVKEAIAQQAGDLINAHVNRTDNPHSVTKTQVGLGSVDNYATATQAEAEAGTVNNKFMTPLRTAQEIGTLALAPLNTHVNNLNNPHQTTKTHVGLGSVANYPVASTAEAQAGTATDRYMTPALVKAAINAQTGTALSAHLADMNNPHQTTKAQVGLGSVQDYGIATTAEAQAGTLNTKYMTPLRVKEAITSQAVDPLNTHIANLNNPHQVNKAHVGLGNVSNYLVATAAQAQAGTVNDRYMTPALVRQAIEALGGGQWIITGNNAWGCAREERSGLTIQWGSSTTIAVGRAQILHYRRKWSNVFTSGVPFTLIPNAWGIPNAADVGEWGKRSPFFATWFAQIDLMAQPAGMDMPPASDACFIGLGRHDTSTANTAQVHYIAFGHTAEDSLVVGAPANGRGYIAAPFTPAGPTTVTLNPAGPLSNTRDVTAAAATVYSDWIAPSMGGGDGNYTVAWSIINNGGRAADISIGRSGNNARLQFNASTMNLVGETDAVTVVLRCAATSLGNTATRDITVTLTAKRVYSVALPTNLDFELGDTGWIKSGSAVIISGAGAYAGNWRGRLTYNGGAATGGFYAAGAKACTPGQTVKVSCRVRAYNAADQVGGKIRLIFLDANGNMLPGGDGVAHFPGNDITVTNGSTTSYRESIATAVAPAGSAYYTVQGEGYVVASSGIIDFDNFNLNYVPPATGPVGGGGGCVATNMYLGVDMLAATVQIGDMVDVAVYDGDNTTITQSPVRKNRVMPQPCYLMTTVSGIQLVASDSTPMTMKDGSTIMFGPEMEGQLVFVDDRGELRWEAVASMEYVGVKDVILFAVDDQCYLAGVEADRRIASHNAADDEKL